MRKSSNTVPQTPPHSSTNVSQSTVLKRNQACHQCRRRKLKCDAKRPCSTCVRSHAHAVAHSPATALPSGPECTFDDIAEVNTTSNEGPKTRYERLENRISELEALLLQKETSAVSISGPQTPMSDTQLRPPLVPAFPLMSGLETKKSMMPDLSELGRLLDSPFVSPSHSSPQDVLEIQWPNWPPGVPGPGLLRHLVEVFFIFHPHANRLFHGPTFIASLSLSPTHPKFPVAPVLHAICAIASLYTAAVSSPPLPDFDKVEPDEIFALKYRIRENRPDSFAEEQAELARETAVRLENLGENLLQVLQARVVLSWFYWSHSRWAEVFLSTAHSLRVVVPLGLNVCPPFHSIALAQRPPSILPAARTVIEDETRRNVFWLAYAAERQHASGNPWCLSMDDMDVSQLLPVRGDQFEKGTLVTPHERQWAHSKDLFLVHPESQTDSFILYIKGAMLISRVKVFNHRFRARHFAGDPDAACTQTMSSCAATDTVDPRESPAFKELDRVVSSFRSSFPPHLKNPLAGNIVDNHLYTACLMPNFATIALHDPHADVRRSGCVSALKILTAARDILVLIYSVWSTSFDITLLDPFCALCWFSAGRVLVRFLQSAIILNNEEHVAALRTEVDFLKSAISKFGERIPLAYRFAKMLEDLIANSLHMRPSSLPSPDKTPALPALQPGGLGDMLYDPTFNVNLDELLQTPP